MEFEIQGCHCKDILVEGHGQKLEYVKIMMKTHHGQYNNQNLWILRWLRNDMVNGKVHRRRGGREIINVYIITSFLMIQSKNSFI